MPPSTTAGIGVHHWIIATVCEEIEAVYFGGLYVAYVVGVYEPAYRRVIVAAVQVVKTGFGIVIIPAIAEGIELCYAIIIR